MAKASVVPSAEVASFEEVRAAVEGLSDADWSRLRFFSRFRMAAVPPSQAKARTAEDLFQEAIKRAVAGERRWPRKVSFVKFLIEAMRSISTAWRNEANPDLAVSEEDLAAVADRKKVMDGAEAVDRVPPDGYQSILASQHLAAIRRHFENDPEVSLIIEGRAEDLEMAEIAATSGLGQKQFDAARKRLRRHLNSLFPNWRPR